MKTNHLAPRLAFRIVLTSALAGGLTAALLACSGDDSNPTPSNDSPVFTVDGGNRTDATTGPTTDSGTDTDDASPNVDAGPEDSGFVRVDAGERDAQSCTGDSGCWSCTPHDDKPLEFLNHCTGSQCSPFDNKTRIPGYVADAALPPLP